MSEVIEQFNKLYPKFYTTPFSQECIVKETDVHYNKTDLLSIKINGISGEQFPYEFACASTSFYKIAESISPVKSDNCDGILYTEVNGKEILLVCELKSGFDIDKLCHAKEQIVGSYMRLKAALSILQDSSTLEIHGLIASYLPSTKKLTQIKNCNDPKGRFAKNLYSRQFHNMIASKCQKLYYPLDVPGFTIHYVGVPQGCQNYELKIEDIFKE